MIDLIRESLTKHNSERLVDKLLESYSEARLNYYEGGHRLSAVEGGRFCEAAYRMLEEATRGSFTPIGGQLDTDKLAKNLASLPAATQPKSIRLHIPRALRVVYDIRNNRDTAHLGDGIDPNIQDANLVIAVLNWVLAEFVRLYHGVSAEQAQAIVDGLSLRRAPVIQEFGEFPRILRTDLRAGEFVLVLLYHVDAKGASYSDLSAWVKSSMVANLRRTLKMLDDKAYLHKSGQIFQITFTGKQYVEDKKLLHPTDSLTSD